jgi:hypothetical protein
MHPQGQHLRPKFENCLRPPLVSITLPINVLFTDLGYYGARPFGFWKVTG